MALVDKELSAFNRKHNKKYHTRIVSLDRCAVSRGGKKSVLVPGALAEAAVESLRQALRRNDGDTAVWLEKAPPARVFNQEVSLRLQVPGGSL